jgi:hypothetical protein
MDAPLTKKEPSGEPKEELPIVVWTFMGYICFQM